MGVTMYIMHFKHFGAFTFHEEKCIERKTEDECTFFFLTFRKAQKYWKTNFEGEIKLTMARKIAANNQNYTCFSMIVFSG